MASSQKNLNRVLEMLQLPTEGITPELVIERLAQRDDKGCAIIFNAHLDKVAVDLLIRLAESCLEDSPH